MAGDFQVSAIVKRGGHYNPHERIEALGNNTNGWMMREDEMIRRIRVGEESFYTMVGGLRTPIVIAVHEGRPYLKTVADGYAPNNLLHLPDCMNCQLVG
jgi:Protein of unknown function (DUF3892)